MKITTLEYNANQPMTKAMTAPTASKYYIGVKVNKDGEAVDCGMDELAVDGLSATSQVAGYNVYELSSDTVEGMKQLDVKVQKRPTTYYYLSSVQNDVAFRQMSNVRPKIYLSSYDLPDTMTFTPFSLSGKWSYTTISGDVYDVDLIKSGRYTTPKIKVYGLTDKFHSAYRTYYFAGEQGWSWDASEGMIYEKSITVPTLSTEIDVQHVIYRDKTMTSEISIQLDFDTKDGLSANFPLQVSQRDMGYFDWQNEDGSSGDSYSRSETSSANELSTAFDETWKKSDKDLSATTISTKRIQSDPDQGRTGTFEAGLGNGLFEGSIKYDDDEYRSSIGIAPNGIMWQVGTVEPDPNSGMFFLMPPPIQHGVQDGGTVATREWVLEQLAALSGN